MAIAYWRKCDFQIHSPRDPNWSGARPIGLDSAPASSGSPLTIQDVENARNKWADTFIEACQQKKLQAIAVTDHHEMVMIPYIRDAITRKRAVDPSFDLWLFPGMELTSKGGVQCIVLFDADLSLDWMRQAEGKLGIEFASLEKDFSKGPPVRQLSCTYSKIGPLLDELSGLKGRNIVLPNVSTGGMHSALTQGAHAEFKSMYYVGGYLDKGQTFDGLSSTIKQRISGNDSKWSTKQIYPLATSDSREADFSRLGDNNAWIKLAAPTAEAIRQAFLSHKSRIRTESPKLPSIFIERFKVKGSSVLPNIDLEFSAELNCIIGGRGSGKSSLLEYIAFGLGRSSHDIARGHYSGTERMKDLIKDTVVAKSATIMLSISQDNAHFEISRGPSTAYQPQVKYPNGTTHPATDRELRSLFPAVVYSQGELADLGKQQGAKPQLADILQFVDSSYKQEDDRMHKDIAAAKSNVKLQLGRLFSFWITTADQRKLKQQHFLLAQRVSALEKALPALSSDDQKIVSDFDAISSFETKRQQASRHADRIVSELSTLESDLSSFADLQPLLPGSATEFAGQYKSLVAIFKNGMKKLQNELLDARTKLNNVGKTWGEHYVHSKNLRDSVLKKLGDHQNVTTQIIKLKDELSNLNSQMGDRADELGKYKNADEQVRSSLEALVQSVENRAKKTMTWADEISKLSNGMIRAAVNPVGDLSELRDAIDVVSAKTGAQEGTKEKGISDVASESNVWEFCSKIRSDCTSLLYWTLVGSGLQEERPNAKDLFAVIGDSEKIKDSMFLKIDAQRVETISTAVPKPIISLFYVDGSNEIAFEKASEGQRASALLMLLLGQPGGPLVVDQPEGDLDNKIISELVERLHAAKEGRQLIFVSHNANIVVNGSSELVSHFDLDEDGNRRISVIGAIDDREVREVITSTMEGGERAFKDRQLKYGF